MIPFTACVFWGTYFFFLYVIIFWLLVLIREYDVEAGSLSESENKPSEYPRVTVAIPAWNEEGNIRETLESVLALDYRPGQLEVITVNDGSTDQTAAVARRVMHKYIGRDLKLITQPNRGKGAALNTALHDAKGEFFVPMDADSLIRRDALRHIIPQFRDPKVAVVLPLMKVWEPHNLLQKVQWCEYLVSIFYKHLMAILDCISIIPGPFSVYRTRILREMGGFDEQNITEDVEMTLRLQKHQHKIIQNFSTEVYTKAPDTWRRFYRQRNRWYKGTFLNAWRYRRMAFNTEYGDFGFIQMPRMIMEAVLLLLAPSMLVYSYILSPLAVQLKIISLTGVDAPAHFSKTLASLSLIDLDWPFYFFVAVIYTLGLILIRYAHKHAREPMLKYGYLIIPSYLFLYSMLMAVVYVGVFADFLRGKTQKW